jgi:ferric-dicitrate binding protein FerR (iron transport regulator)
MPPNVPHAGAQAPHPVRRWRVAALFALCIAAAALAGCAHGPGAGSIVLSGVVQAGEVVAPERVAPERLRVVRKGYPLPLKRDTVLEQGDQIWTGADTNVVISYPGGARAYVYPDSRMRIGSIIAEIGKVFVKVKGLFTVSTTFVTAGSEGTQYWVTVDAQDHVNVVVVEDTISLSSNTGAWPLRRMRPGERASMVGTGGPEMSPASAADIQRETDWVQSMDRMLPMRAGVNPWAIGAGAAAVGLGWWLLHDDDEKPRDATDSGRDKPKPVDPYRR